MAKSSDVTKSGAGQVQQPVDVFSAMRSEMDRMFERFEHGLPSWSMPLTRRGERLGLLIPDVDVHEDPKQLTVEVELPGVDEKDVSVTLSNGILSIKGTKKTSREETKNNYHMAERSYGSFERALRLPDSVDDGQLTAKFDQGVLRIVAQKRPEAVKAERKIEISKG